jgi:glycosyltransferase involved in cell wall biosynthesis
MKDQRRAHALRGGALHSPPSLRVAARLAPNGHRPASVTTAAVLIRTKNEASALGTTLDAVFRQSHPPTEVIVIDSGSTDGTLAVAAAFPVQAMSIAPRDWGYSRALNRAAARATADVLVCLSAHCVPLDAHWLAHLVSHFTEPRVAGVWGPQLRPGRPEPTLGPVFVQEPGTYGRDNWMWGLSNANSAIRRDLWSQLPFDETMPAAEDKAWGKAAMERGYCIVHDPRAAVWHERHAFRASYRRQRAVMQGYRRMFPRDRDPLRNQLLIVGRAAVRAARFHVQERDPKLLWYDVRRAPSSLAAIVGGISVRRDC